MDYDSNLASLQNNYLSIFHRRLEWLNASTASQKLAQTMKNFENLKTVANMVEYLIEES